MKFRMFLFAGLFVSLSIHSAVGQSHNADIQKKFDAFIEYSNNSDWDKVFDASYPKLFNQVPKVELVAMM